jgi:peptidoglycan/LPS O-acetylase OafA/YrhL
VLQLLVVAGPGSLATPVFIAAGLAVTAILAAFSWYWVEKPALGRKHSELPDRIAALVLRGLPTSRPRVRTVAWAINPHVRVVLGWW